MSIFEKGFIHIGDSAMVSDPCYKPGTWCQGIIKQMKPGAYQVYGEIVDCDTWGNRVSRIWIVHEDFVNVDINAALSYNYEDFEVGVDSGQAGIYDHEYYMEQWSSNQKSEDWYSRVCDETYDSDEGFNFNSLDEKCVISSSGFGDGSYTCQTGRTAEGQCVYIEIDFDVEDDDDFGEDEDYVPEDDEWD